MNHHESERRRALKERLQEDTGAVDETLLNALHEWRNEPPIAPDPARQRALIAQLEGMVTTPTPRRTFGLLPLLIMRAQLKIVRGAIFAVSAVVMLIGVGVSLVLYRPNTGVDDLPMVLIAPIVTAFGLALLYGAEIDSAMEIEQTTPVSPAMVMLARVALVFGFDLIAGLVASVILSLVLPGVSLWPLVWAWFAPMAFLSALAFLLSVFFLDSAVGIVSAAVLWAMLLTARYLQDKPIWFRLPDLLTAETRPVFFVAAIPLFLLALWLCEQREVQFRRGA
jgi:hypothetical protein